MYNQLDDYGQAQFAQENERLHEFAMRKVAYDNQPPFRQRVKTSLDAIGQKLSTTKNRVSSWWRGGSDDNPEKEFDALLSTQKEYHSSALIEQADSPHTDFAKTCLQQQAHRSSEDPFNTETMLSKLEKKSAELSQENSDENQKEKEQKLEEKRDAIFSADICIVPGMSSNSTEHTASSSTKEAESPKKPSLFPAEKPKQDDKDKKPHGIPQEIKEKYEEYKKQETKKHDPALKSTNSPQPTSSGSVTGVNKEPMIDVINKESKEFMAKLNLPQTTSNTNAQSARPSTSPPAATSVPTSPLSQINNYQNYSASAPTRAPSAQTQSLQTQRQQYSNQISQAARRESSTARAWGGSQERRHLEAERSQIESAIRYQETFAKPSYIYGWHNKKKGHYEFQGAYYVNTEFGHPNFGYHQIMDYYDRRSDELGKISFIRKILKDSLISSENKQKILNAWYQETKKYKVQKKQYENYKDALKGLKPGYIHHRNIIYDMWNQAHEIYLQQIEWETTEILPILRSLDHIALSKILGRTINNSEIIQMRRNAEYRNIESSEPEVSFLLKFQYKKRRQEEIDKIGIFDGTFYFTTKKKEAKRKIKNEILYKTLDAFSEQKKIEHELELADERAEQERLQKELELAQRKEANAKLVGEKLAYEAKKIRLQQEFELEQSKKRLESILQKINAPHFQRPEKDSNQVVPLPTLDQIELIVEQSTFSWQEIVEQPALDFISSNPHRVTRTDPHIISELIANPATPKNIVDLLEQARFLQDNVDNNTLSDLSSTATELILLGEMISKKMAEKSFARNQEEAEQYEKLQKEIVRISTFIVDCVNIAAKEIQKKRKEHYALFKFVSENPIETIKIVTPVIAHITQKIVRLAVVLAPYDDVGPDLFVQDLTDGTISDVQKIPLEELTALVDASGKYLVNFLLHTPRREQVRGVVDFGFDLVAQHFIFKSCAMLKSTLRSNFIQANTLKALAATAEEMASLNAAIELASQQKKLVHAVEYAFEGNVAPTAENIGRTQRVNEILDLSTEFSQSEKASEILSKLNKGSSKNAALLQEQAAIKIEADLFHIKAHLEHAIAHLETVYDKSIIDEAKAILKFDNDRVLIKMHKPEVLLESTIRDIMKIDSNPRWKNFRFDPAKNYKCDYNTIEEAIAGIACEEQGLLESLIRDPKTNGGGEFIDQFGKVWDVKTAKSEALTGRKIFESKRQINDFLESVRDELTKKAQENVIINITYLDQTDHYKFYDGLKKLLSKSEIERIIIIDATNPINSKCAKSLLKLLEGN